MNIWRQRHAGEEYRIYWMTIVSTIILIVADCFVVCGTIAALVYYIWIYPNTDAKNWEKDHGTDPAQGK